MPESKPAAKKTAAKKTAPKAKSLVDQDPTPGETVTIGGLEYTVDGNGAHRRKS